MEKRGEIEKGKVEGKGAKGSSFTALKSMSVEPAGFLVIISVVVSFLIFQNLMMETICRVDLSFPEDKCREIINKVNATYKSEETQIQKVAAKVQAITSSITSGCTVLVVLFVGPWSDVNGRKKPLLISVFGLMIFSFTMFICYLMIGKITAIWLSLGAMLPMTICGGGVVFTMSAYSYISDTTSSKMRTVRTGILSATVRSGTPVGFALAGLLTRFGVSTITSLTVAFSLALMAFLIIVATVKDASPAELNRCRRKEEEEEEEEERGDADVDGPTAPKKSVWIRYNPLMKLIEALGILWKKRTDRANFYLLIAVFICYAAPGPGEYSLLYLFVRKRLGWDISLYGFFSMYNWLMSAVGVVVSMYVLSRTLKISDPLLGFIAGLSQIGGSTLYAFTETFWMMYLSSGIDMMNGTIGVVVRSMLSKAVKPDEVGKLFALLGVLESLLPLLMVPTYSILYTKTVESFPGAFFLLSAGVTFPAQFIFIYFICKGKKGGGGREGDGSSGAMNSGDTPDDSNSKDVEGVPELVKLMPSEIYSSKDCVMGVFETKRKSICSVENTE